MRKVLQTKGFLAKDTHNPEPFQMRKQSALLFFKIDLIRTDVE